MHTLLNSDHHSVWKCDKFVFKLRFSFTFFLLSNTKSVICKEICV